ncbi:MAG: DegT/DnrJ/EryC1/StrS family aminotransferase [Nanoarchaeota archaeon]
MTERLSWKKWEKAGDPHLMNRIQWGEEEKQALESVFQSDWFGYGDPNKRLEGKLSDFTGIPHVHLTNSGSAAIENGLLALKHSGRWMPGDKVLHPVTTFATSISSAINLGLVPVFIETEPHTYVADPEQVSAAVRKYPDIKGMILPHLLGNVSDLEGILESLGESRFLLEDCCDTLGSKYSGKHVGSYGDVAAYSFYGSHHITTGGVGGAVATKDGDLGRILKSLIFWGRDFSHSNDDFLKRYEYKTLGTDSQMTALQAAFGLKQIDRLPKFVEERKKQFNEMTELFQQYGIFHLPQTHSKSDPSWFSYPLAIKGGSSFNRSDFAQYLAENNVEVRPIMCGNITKQKPFGRAEWLSLYGNSFPIGDCIEERALFVPSWGMPEDQRKDYYRILNEFLEARTR